MIFSYNRHMLESEIDNSICSICGNPAYAGHNQALHTEAKSSTKNPKILINKEKSNDPEDQRFAAEARGLVESVVEDFAIKAQQESIEFSPEMLKFIEAEKFWHE